MRYGMIALLGVLYLSACSLHTDIQTRYVDQRDQCRDLATLKQQTFAQSGNQTDSRSRDVDLLTYFSDCMGERGWTVAKPTTPPTPPIELDARQKPVAAGAGAATGAVAAEGVYQTPVDAPQPTMRKRPEQNLGGPAQNTPLGADDTAPLSLQNPSPSPSAVPQGSVSTSNAGVPVYESPTPAGITDEDARTMEQEFLRANRRR